MDTITLQEPFRAVFYAPLYAAVARGAFAAEGVEVRLLPGGGPAAAADAVLAGAADMAWSGPMRLIQHHARDPSNPLRCFCAVVVRDPFLLVGRGPRPGFDLRDLAALSLGSVSEVPTPWWCLQDDLRRAGLDPARLRRVSDRPMAENAAAVAAGTLDVAQVFEPHAARLEAAGAGHVWHEAASRGPTAYTSLYAAAARMAERRAAFAAVVRAVAASLAWIAAAPADEVAAAVADFFPEVEPDALRRSLARYGRLGIWARDPRLPREAFDRLEAAMLSAGAVDRAPGFDACVDEGLVDEALGAGRAAGA